MPLTLLRFVHQRGPLEIAYSLELCPLHCPCMGGLSFFKKTVLYNLCGWFCNTKTRRELAFPLRKASCSSRKTPKPSYKCMLGWGAADFFKKVHKLHAGFPIAIYNSTFDACFNVFSLCLPPPHPPLWRWPSAASTKTGRAASAGPPHLCGFHNGGWGGARRCENTLPYE